MHVHTKLLHMASFVISTMTSQKNILKDISWLKSRPLYLAHKWRWITIQNGITTPVHFLWGLSWVLVYNTRVTSSSSMFQCYDRPLVDTPAHTHRWCTGPCSHKVNTSLPLLLCPLTVTGGLAGPATSNIIERCYLPAPDSLMVLVKYLGCCDYFALRQACYSVKCCWARRRNSMVAGSPLDWEMAAGPTGSEPMYNMHLFNNGCSYNAMDAV